jgi:hypothetical protein
VSRFDTDALLRAAVDQAATISQDLTFAIMDSAALREAVLRLQEDVSATLKAIEQETDAKKLANLQRDLAEVLPKRRKVIVSIAKSHGGAALEDAAERALKLLSGIVIAAARSFILGPAA